MPLLEFAQPEKKKKLDPLKKLGEMILPLASSMLEDNNSKGAQNASSRTTLPAR